MLGFELLITVQKVHFVMFMVRAIFTQAFVVCLNCSKCCKSTMSSLQKVMYTVVAHTV